MNWKTKALIMKISSLIPYGDKLYIMIQKKYGRLSLNPQKRINTTLDILKLLNNNNYSVSDKTFFEVGTGHKPVIPICLFLCGAGKVYTYDLNKRLDLKFMQKILEYFSLYSNDIIDIFKAHVDEKILINRFTILKEYCNKPDKFLEKANIIYRAPEDAGNSKLDNDSIDFHFSVTTFEHIPYNVLKSILNEAYRVLKKGGLAIHLIDLTDHFYHQDKSISSINFLQYSTKKWMNIAGNQFAYCNRLRINDFDKLINETEFQLIDSSKTIDDEAVHLLEKDFKIADEFKELSNNDLATIEYNIILKK